MKRVYLLLLAVVLLYFVGKYLIVSTKNRFRKLKKSFFHQPENIRNKRDQWLDPKEKGDRFEEYILSLFDFKSNRFILKEWRSDKIYNGIYPESNHYPDFEIQLNAKKTLAIFAVECKYRSSWNQDTVEWAKGYQINNYKNYEKQYNIPVFIVLGVGGQPGNPAELYILPLKKLHHTTIDYDDVQKVRKHSLGTRLFYNHEYQSLR